MTTVALSAGICAASRGAVVSSDKDRTPACQHQPGHTTFRRGKVRVFSRAGDVYGCLIGDTRRVLLWVNLMEQQSSVKQVAGRYVAVESIVNNQYTYARSLSMIDLANGAGYSIGSLNWPLGGESSGDPRTPGPWPLEAFVLGANGRTARLYGTFAAGASSSAHPTGQVLDVIGYRHFNRTIATTGASAISPASLTYNGREVTWTQDGAAHSATP